MEIHLVPRRLSVPPVAKTKCIRRSSGEPITGSGGWEGAFVSELGWAHLMPCKCQCAYVWTSDITQQHIPKARNLAEPGRLACLKIFHFIKIQPDCLWACGQDAGAAGSSGSINSERLSKHPEGHNLLVEDATLPLNFLFGYFYPNRFFCKPCKAMLSHSQTFIKCNLI